jgi:hypothetical protein
MERFVRLVIRKPWATLAALLGLTLLLGSHLPHLRIETSLYDLIIEDLPASREYKAFKEHFGSEEIILVAMKSHETVFLEPTFAVVERISEALGKVEGVQKVISLPEIKKAMDITGSWTLRDFEAILSPVALFDRNLLSKDRKTTVACLVLADTKLKGKLINEVDEIIEREGKDLTVYQVGIPLVAQALEHSTLRDFKTLPVITLCVIGVVLFFCFRSLRGIFIPLGTVLVTLTWTFGLMAWTDTPISMVTMIAPVLIIALGTAYTLYIMPQYLALARNRLSVEETVFACIQHLLLPTFITSLTTIIGFGSLLVSRIDAIQQFAFFSCVGIVSFVVCELTLIPAVLALLPLPAVGPEEEGGSSWIQKMLEMVVAINKNHRKVVLPLALVMTVAAAAGIPRIQVETDALSCLKESSAVRQRFTDIYRDVAGSSPINVVIESATSGYWEDLDHIKLIEKIQGFLDSVDGVDKSVSWVDYAKLMRYATNQYDARYYAPPEFSFEVGMGLNTLSMILGQEVLKQFVSDDLSRVNILLRTHMCSSKEFLEARGRIMDYLEASLPKDLRFEVTGLSIAIAHSARKLTVGQVESLSLSLALIFIIMVFLFMSVKVGLIAVLPNLIPIVLLFGIMGWLQIKLSLVTSLIAGIAIGIAVDDTVHYLTTYNRELKKDWNRANAMERTVLEVGRPVAFTSFCIIAGFSVLMFSSFQPTAVFGLLMVITMLTDFFGNLFVLPSLMLHVELVTVWDLLRIRMGKDPQKAIPLFKGLSRRQVRRVILAGLMETFGEDEVVFRKGDPGESMYAVVSGEVKVVDGVEEQETVIAVMGRGEVFGEMGMIRSRPRTATVVATKETELLKVNQRMLKRLHWLFPLAAQKFFLNLVVILCDRLEIMTLKYLEGSRHESEI